MRDYQLSGFTLIEMLIVIAIISILVAITLPSYRNYTRKAHYTEVVQAAAPYKLGIEECFQLTGDLSTCNEGNHGVPAGVPPGTGTGLIDAIAIKDNGVLVITPKEKYGIMAADTYILTPTEQQNKLIWTTSGGGVAAGLAN